jgi:ribosomal protein S10
MFFKLSLKSKNVNSLKNFIFTLNSIENTLNEKGLKIKPIKKLKKVLFSILKSPHVNKTSQEQFDYVYYSSEVLIFTNNYLKVLLFLKLLSNKFFSSINMKVTVITSYKDSHYLCLGSHNQKVLFHCYCRLISCPKGDRFSVNSMLTIPKM